MPLIRVDDIRTRRTKLLRGVIRPSPVRGTIETFAYAPSLWGDNGGDDTT